MLFSRDDDAGWSQSIQFKKAFAVDVKIEFVGVWYVPHFTRHLPHATHARFRDTVCSVGKPSRALPFTASNTAVRYFRHAISLDEHRAKFKANHWNLLKSEDEKGTRLGEMSRPNQRHSRSESQAEEEFYTGPETDVLEVWFAGVHCGSSPFSLSDAIVPNVVV